MPFPFYQTVASNLSLLANKKSFWWLMFAALLFPFVILAMYNHPSADDYCYVVDAAIRGFWQSQWTTYQNWSGRYISTFLLVSSPLAIGSFLGYQMISFLLLLLIVVSCLFFVKVLLNKKSFDFSVVAVSFCMVLLYLFKMPSVTEGFYWLAGAITYQLPNIATLTVVTLLLTMRRTEKYYKWKLSAAVFLSIMICGGNETSMLEFVYILVALMAFEYTTTRSIPKHYYLLLIVSLVAASIILLAPGNAVRAAHFQGEKNIVKALLMAATSGFHRIEAWAFDVVVLLILFLPFLRQLEISNTNERKIKPVVLFLYPFFIAGILIGGYFPAFWSIGFEPPSRTVNVLYFLFLASSFHYAVLCVTYVKQKNGVFITIPLFAQWVLFVLLFRSMAPHTHYHTAIMDLVSGRARTYNLEMEMRYLEVKKHEHEDVVFKPLTAIPTSIFFTDIEAEHPEDWKNLCTRDYFHLKSLNLTKAKE